PPALKSPYAERRSAFAKERYSALGIAREDLEARQRAAIANWDCFGAPAALFCYIDRDLGLPQWADLGMYLQTVMLLLRAEGLHSCPQMAWSQVRKTVAEFVSPPAELILFCGMSIGYEDETVPYIRTGRAPLDETVTFVQGSPKTCPRGADVSARADSAPPPYPGLPPGRGLEWRRVWKATSGGTAMPETPSLDPRRTGDLVAATDEPLAVPDCAGGLRTPAGAAKGYKDRAHVRKYTDLDPLRQRDDYRKLVAELEGKGK